jgi:hypothetical protein
MNKCHRKLLAFFLLTLFSSTPLFAKTDNTITLRDGWIRETPPGVQNAAAFLTLHNSGTASKSISAIQCAAVAARCELHEHIKTESGGMRMQQVRAPLTIPANGTLTFVPGGYHIMLFDIKMPLRADTHIPLLFVFDDQSTFTVQLPVKSIRAE